MKGKYWCFPSFCFTVYLFLNLGVNSWRSRSLNDLIFSSVIILSHSGMLSSGSLCFIFHTRTCRTLWSFLVAHTCCKFPLCTSEHRQWKSTLSQILVHDAFIFHLQVTAWQSVISSLTHTGSVQWGPAEKQDKGSGGAAASLSAGKTSSCCKRNI